MDALIKEMEQIVYSGTKLNINRLKCWTTISKKKFNDYFMESETDNIEKALNLMGLRFRRIAIDANKFISEVAN
jgi:ATP-dependent DNA helicase RecQ